MNPLLKALPLAVLAMVAGCETRPQGPTVTALQGEARSIDEFRADVAECKRYAVEDRGSIAPGGNQGSLIDGIDSAQFAGYGLQRRYNRAYVQCMYARGNKVPVLARERWPAARSPWPPDPDAYLFPLQR